MNDSVTISIDGKPCFLFFSSENLQDFSDRIFINWPEK